MTTHDTGPLPGSTQYWQQESERAQERIKQLEAELDDSSVHDRARAWDRVWDQLKDIDTEGIYSREKTLTECALAVVTELAKWKTAAMRAWPSGFTCVRILSCIGVDCETARIPIGSRCAQCEINELIFAEEGTIEWVSATANNAGDGEKAAGHRLVDCWCIEDCPIHGGPKEGL